MIKELTTNRAAQGLKYRCPKGQGQAPAALHGCLPSPPLCQSTATAKQATLGNSYESHQ